MRQFDLEIDGERVHVRAEKVGGKLWFHYDGETYVEEPKVATGQKGGAKGGDPNLISAPMPGKIIKVMKKVGDKVQEGETVVVMEAMKMEYNLKAVRQSLITSVKINEGQTVSHGQKLVELKEDN